MNPQTIDSLRAEIQALRQQQAERDRQQAEQSARLTQRLESVERHYTAARRRARRMTALAVVALAVAVCWGTGPQVQAQFGVTLASLNQRLLLVEQKTAALLDNGTDLAIIGRNVHILDGSGATDSDSGLGNLTVGYNEWRGDETDDRTGTHNLILGDLNNYSSFGGLVAGRHNAISGPYATISGGNSNTASGLGASISGGGSNTASGLGASISGGGFNTASGLGASISGGWGNTASGSFASVSGGGLNTASGDYASVSGGEGNTASGALASVSGGRDREAPGGQNWRAGGLFQDN